MNEKLQSFEKPTQVQDVELAFGGDMAKLLPEFHLIPDEFRRLRSPWVEAIDQWFYNGLKKDTAIEAKDGIDGCEALRHIQAILRSFQPKHEHKTAGCAYLLSRWFKRFGTIHVGQ